jgi:3-hydroxybutyryl-CoA dehydrogenase
VPGHVANRLQAALWREALHLVKSGVASVRDVDTAVWAGPGMRWAVMGPTMLFHLGAGAGGIASFCERYTGSFNRWWDDLGTLHLDDALAEQLAREISAEVGAETPASLSAKRDAQIIALQRAITDLRRSGESHK